ncbi:MULTISPECIES: LysR family transcriptional regulator [Marinovum]|jgi:DNA-binding transcriptional LysR family regulator|uniref:LysR family transcriptional regulator n=1 Tax=Marinovum TaxID=367771 RepID=UPI00237A79A4|nr:MULTISPECIES: LysR family transcriptional regulator [Marinovum]MDD9739239.1 LysR family transcriptional regulator [Marinovum sp. SP66]
MQSRLLKSFLAVADKSSITEAAAALNVSQPALTKSIKQLEADLGVTLFERTSTGVSLTRFGSVLQHHAKIMENEYRHALSRIDDLKGGRKGTIRIGAGPIWLVAILPPIIARFQRENPDVDISLLGGVIDTLVPDLLNGDLDIICVSLDFPNRPEIAKQPLINVRHVLIADPSHPLAKRRDLSPAAIHGYPWMMLRSDYVGNERIASFFASHGLSPPNIAFETTSIHSLLQGLRNGHYIAHVPDRMLPLANSMGLEELRLNQTIWETPAGVAWRTGARPSASIQKFMTILSEQTS